MVRVALFCPRGRRLAKRSVPTAERQLPSSWDWQLSYDSLSEMSYNIVTEKYENDGKLNGLSAFSDKNLAPINGRYRSKSLSSDKLNKSSVDRTAILEDVETNHVSEKSETPGCLVQNKIMEQGSHNTMNGWVCVYLCLTRIFRYHLRDLLIGLFSWTWNAFTNVFIDDPHIHSSMFQYYNRHIK